MHIAVRLTSARIVGSAPTSSRVEFTVHGPPATNGFLYPSTDFPYASSSTDLKVANESWIDENSNGDCDPGEGVTYECVFENTGTVTLYNLTTSDNLLGDTIVCNWPEDDKLEPGGMVHCAGTYEVRRYRGHPQRVVCTLCLSTAIVFRCVEIESFRLSLPSIC